ncbi:YhcN/YlaJ family sporulation lipoprotein [Bacillus massilinigeriensis]|uniref:YhcN/YlaJ family sporulation lipoprotein n=1 Tax=Bacillus mediterraneensis TaxID=1805474 RepID=UPI001F2DE496|nr:YhcN/YlaJ family sporulation lipoprotein [Bacillus mediterraneensis]
MQQVNPEPAQVEGNNKKDKKLALKVKRDIQSLPQIYDVAVVRGKKDTLVVYKVKHMHRMRMKQIEKDINKMLEKNYPKENFTVSSDFKIFIEAIELKDKMENQSYSEKEAEEKLQKVIELKKAMT